MDQAPDRTPVRVSRVLQLCNEGILRRRNLTAHNALVDAVESLDAIITNLEQESPGGEALRPHLSVFLSSVSTAGACIIHEIGNEFAMRIRPPSTALRDEEDGCVSDGSLRDPGEFRRSLESLFRSIGDLEASSGAVDGDPVELKGRVSRFAKGAYATLALYSTKGLADRRFSLLGDYAPSKALNMLLQAIVGDSAAGEVRIVRLWREVSSAEDRLERGPADRLLALCRSMRAGIMRVAI